MDPTIRRFLDADAGCGPDARELSIGDHAIRFEGLSGPQAAALARYWGPFLARESGRPVYRSVRVCDAGPGGWLPLPGPGELYRVESLATPDGIVTLSYAFALGLDREGRWRVALASDGFEPAVQSLENAARVLTARMAGELGGFALHSAGVVRDGRAWIFAGPSGSGKSTAARMTAPAVSLGDDFGLVLPDGRGGWVAPPVPFDNVPEIVGRPQRSLYPVAGIWRLFRADSARVERRTGLAAATSLSTCTALPWALPDLAGSVIEQIGRFCAESFFGHLHFGLDTDIWQALQESLRDLD